MDPNNNPASNPADNQPITPQPQVIQPDAISQPNTIISPVTPETTQANQIAPITVQPTVENAPIQPLVTEPNIAAPQSPVIPAAEQPQVVTTPQPQPDVVNPLQPVQASVAPQQEVVTPSPQVISAEQPQSVAGQAQPAITQPQVQPLNMSAAQPLNGTQAPTGKPKKVPLITLAAQLTFRGQDTSKPKSLIAKIFGIFMIIVALAASAGCIYATQHIKGARQAIKEYSNPYAAKKESDAKKAIKESGPDTQKLNGGKLDLSKLFEASIAERPQDIKGKVNEQINMADGISFAVTGVERGWTTGDDYYKARKNKEYIKIALTAGYRGKTGTGYASYSDFRLLNSKGGLQDTIYLSDKFLPDNELTSGSSTLNPGDSKSGWLVYEIDKGEQVTLLYEEKGYDSASKEFYMKGSVELK